jgi:hypothetical protein
MAPQAGKALTAAGEQLMGIGLMAHVPNNFIRGGFEDVVQGYPQLHGTQTGSQVPPGDRHHINDGLTDLFGQIRQFGAAQFLQVTR